MSLSRHQLLEEMGLAPRRILRETRAVARGESCEECWFACRAAADAQADEFLATVADDRPACGAERSAQIAQLGWEPLRQSIAACRACALCSERKQAVAGVGDENADWLFIGEGPGAEEDARGEPFVGPAGKLLDAMLVAIDLKRGEDVYIANAVKCRPPSNRTPEAGEMAACAPYLKRQIALLQPRHHRSARPRRSQCLAWRRRPAGQSARQAAGLPRRRSRDPGGGHLPPAYLLRTLPDKAWQVLEDPVPRARAGALAQRRVKSAISRRGLAIRRSITIYRLLCLFLEVTAMRIEFLPSWRCSSSLGCGYNALSRPATKRSRASWSEVVQPSTSGAPIWFPIW